MCWQKTGSRTHGSSGAGLLLLVTGLVLGAQLFLASGATARIVVDHNDVGKFGPAQAFAALARAWTAGDMDALADLVQDEGVTVNTGGGQERDTRYSPSQAYYYFKNLFQNRTTVAFDFEKTEDAARGPRVHGLALWEFKSPNGEGSETMKLVFVLVLSEERWQLSEISTIR